MKRLTPFILLLFAVGCASEIADPLPDEAQLAKTGQGSQVLASITGHWDRDVPTGPNEGRQQKVSLSAKLLADWTPTGSIEWMFHFPGERPFLSMKEQVTCIASYGNVAWLGTVTVGPPGNPNIGDQRVWWIWDEPRGNPDFLDFTYDFGDDCYAEPWLRLLPLTHGEIQIHQPGLNSFTDNVIFPIDMMVDVPCALGGAGETVHLTGELHSVFHVTEDESGGYHTVSHSQPQGVSGVGLTSGDRYQGTGVTRWTTNFNVFPYNDTFINNFRIIGQGPGNNYTIHHNIHVTINANGDVTADVDNFKAECK